MTALDDLLPPTVIDIADLIGYAKARALVDRLGGARFRFTGPMREVVIAAVGDEAYALLVGHYGSEVVDLPRCAALLRHVQIAGMMAAVRQGASSNTLALAHGVTRRTITNWKKAAGEVDVNFNIFD